jgi:hypothetical protein
MQALQMERFEWAETEWLGHPNLLSNIGETSAFRAFLIEEGVGRGVAVV